jgi:hypothetical protein
VFLRFVEYLDIMRLAWSKIGHVALTASSPLIDTFCGRRFSLLIYRERMPLRGGA